MNKTTIDERNRREKETEREGRRGREKRRKERKGKEKDRIAGLTVRTCDSHVKSSGIIVVKGDVRGEGEGRHALVLAQSNIGR